MTDDPDDSDTWTDPRLERRLRRLDKPDGRCFHCEGPAGQHHPVGPITVTISAPDDDDRTLEFCNWVCLGHWAAERAGGSLIKIPARPFLSE
jgi:hypothetical protein